MLFFYLRTFFKPGFLVYYRGNINSKELVILDPMYLQVRHLQLKTKEDISRYGRERTKRGLVVLQRLKIIDMYGLRTVHMRFFTLYFESFIVNLSLTVKNYPFLTQTYCESIYYRNNLSSISSHLSRVG